MVSKEPNHLLTGQTNGKSALSDKLPGTMTVRSVLLNRDSPDIESRLKRRRNRTHQVRFKDLEDGSSSSGNSGTGENTRHQKPAKDSDSPHALRNQSGRSHQPWTDRDGPRTSDLPGQTSVVGAVRGDMASTIEKVAAFLARAPPHPLTPGPTRRCWAPPQNSLTLPMTRRLSTSTSTAIQTSPCLKKPQSFTSTNTRSHSLRDSVGVEGDDEHDSQDEYLTHNHVIPGSKDQTGPPPGPGDRTVLERRSKSSRTELKSAVSSVKNPRHSCPPSVLHNTEPYHCSAVSCRDGPKRQGNSTPSALRRKKRLNRTASDPGKEVHYCTTLTQTEDPSPSPQPSNNVLCTTQVQTAIHSTPKNSRYCTAQSQTESHSSLLSDKKCTTQTEMCNSCPTIPPNSEQHTTEIQTDSLWHSPGHQPCTTQSQICSPCPSPSLTVSSSSVDVQSQSSGNPTIAQDPPDTSVTTVPYLNSPPSTSEPTQITDQCCRPSASSPAKSVCTIEPPPPIAPSSPCSTSASTEIQKPVPYYTVVSPPTTPSTVVACSSPSSDASFCPTHNSTSPISNTVSSAPTACSTSTPSETINTTFIEPSIDPSTAPNATHQPLHNTANDTPLTNQAACTFATQTTLSCTSISYYSTTHPIGAVPNSIASSYATVIQTVSHCNIPCKSLLNISAANAGINPVSSPVPKINSCTSPPPLVKTYAPTLPNTQPCATPTKAVPLYSSTFRAAPPYTPPSQAPHSAQDKRGIRLPPPPPLPPPYTPRKKGNDPSGSAIRTPVLRADSKVSKKDKDTEGKKEELKCPDSPKLCERASSLKHRAQTPPVTVIKGEKQSSSPVKACFKSSCLSSAQAQLGVLHKMLCSGASARPNTPNSQHLLLPNIQGCQGAKGCSASGECTAAGPLSVSQADTLRQVQEILGGLVSGARCKLDPSRVTEKLLSPNGPLHDIRSLQTQLHSLEGVLETSQNTIKVLLDVIQDLEKKEAERDGRHSYRTGQDIENCGTCRDCACIIYSVEHDFRLQEGQVVRTWKVGDPPEGMPQPATPQSTTPHQQDSPQPVRPPATTKKNRKKCFWFL